MNDIVILAVDNPLEGTVLWTTIETALRAVALLTLVWAVITVIKSFLGGRTIEAVRKILIIVIAMVFLLDPGILFSLTDLAQGIVQAAIDAVESITGGGGSTPPADSTDIPG